jgi:hypothetical protein
MRGALLGATLLFLLGSVPAWADTPADSPVVMPVQAGGILDEAWGRREDALAQRNRTVVASVDEGPALADDLAWMDGLVSDRPGGSGRRGLVGQTVLVPRQLSYPAFFVAATRVTNAPDPTGGYRFWTALVVMVRQDQASPWRIRMESWANGPPEARRLEQVLSADSSERFAPPAGPMGIAPEQFAARLSSHYRQFAAQPIDPLNVFTVGLASESQLLCFGRQYIQQENQPWWNPAKAKANDYRGIAEGSYRQLTSTYQDQRCALVEPAASGAPAATVLTREESFVSHQELPAIPPPWLPIALVGIVLTIGLTAAVWRLRPRPPSSDVLKPEVVLLRDLERQNVLAAALRALMVALIVIELERWLIPRSPFLAATLALMVMGPFAWRLVPQSRRVKVSGRILVRRPVAEVFEFVSDLRNEPKWQPLMVAVEPVPSESSPGVKRYRSQQRLGDGLVLEYESRNTESAGQPAVISSDMVGKWFPDQIEWRFNAVPEGTVVTLTRRSELGPLRAIALMSVDAYRRIIRQFTLGDLDRLETALSGESPAPEHVADGEISREYGWMRRLPVIGQSDLAISIASFIGCWVLYSRVMGDWFATGIMLMLLVHEVGHYVEARRVGLTTRPPVFVLLGAFVRAEGARIDGLMHARISLAGGLAGGLATAVALALYVLTGSPHLLPWVAAGAAANLFGSLLPFITVDVEAILLVVGRWLPAVGVFAALAAAGAAAGLGVADPLIPGIVFLAFVVLRLRYPGRWQRDQGALPTRARLVIAAAWFTLVAYLSLVFFLTAGWLV